MDGTITTVLDREAAPNLAQLVDQHVTEISGQALNMLRERFRPVTERALTVAREAVAKVDAERADLDRRFGNGEVRKGDYDYATAALTRKRSAVAQAALDEKILPELQAAGQQLAALGGPPPLDPGGAFTVASVAQLLASLPPTQMVRMAQQLVLHHAVKRTSPAMLVPVFESMLERKDLDPKGPHGKSWSALHDLVQATMTLGRSWQEVAAAGSIEAVRSLQGSLRMLADGFSQPGGLERSPAWLTGALADFGGPRGSTKEDE